MQPHLRTQYSEQYNLTIQRALGRNMMMQVGYVGSQGHRLLVSHDINYGNTQSCLDLMNLSTANNDPSYTCAQNYADNAFYIPATATLPANFTLHLPYGGPNGGPIRRERRSQRHAGLGDRSQRHHPGGIAAVLIAPLPAAHRHRLPRRWHPGVLQHLCRRHHRQLQLQLVPGHGAAEFLSRTAVPGRLYLGQVVRPRLQL